MIEELNLDPQNFYQKIWEDSERNLRKKWAILEKANFLYISLTKSLII
jgi:hypothetical protein